LESAVARELAVNHRALGDHTVWLRLEGPVFEVPREPEVFRANQAHPEFHTLVWANGADLVPEFLHDNIKVTA
jgi:hypothetical protein